MILIVFYFCLSLTLNPLENQAIREIIMTLFDTLGSYGGENQTTH